MRELTFTKATETLVAINADEAIAINAAIAKATTRIRRQHETYRNTVLSKLPAELRDLAVKRARGCNHEGIGLPGCKTCDPRTIAEGGPQPDPDDVPAMPAHEIDAALEEAPPVSDAAEVPERLRVPLSDARLAVGKSR